MVSFIDDLRRAPTPLAVSNRESIASLVKGVHVRLLRAILLSQSLDVHEIEVASLRRYALWLEALRFSADIERDAVASLSGTLFEFVALASSTSECLSIFQPPLSDYLRSAIISSFTPYQAHSSLVGKRVLQGLQSFQPQTAVGRSHQLAAMTVAAFVARQFHEAFTYGNDVRALATSTADELQATDATPDAIVQLDRSLAIAETVGVASAGMMTGNEFLVERAEQIFWDIRQEAKDDEDPNRFWLADRLHLLTHRMREASIHRILRNSKIPEGYRHALAREGYSELWEPQLDAVKKGILEPENKSNFVISVPTGAGKTLLAEMALLTSLSSGGWALYITPSRALVNQVSADLRKRLSYCNLTVRTILAGAEQSIVTVEEELNLLQMERTVTVTTPEKFDAYYRNNKEIFHSCKMIVFDEIHKVTEGDRGPLIESLVTRLIVGHPDVRLFIMSGVMSNADEMVDWLGSARTRSVVMRRRPVRQVHGVAVRQDYTIIPGWFRHQNRQYRRAKFDGGVVLVHEEADLSGEINVDLLNVFSGEFSMRIYQEGQYIKEDRHAPHSSANDHAVAIARSLLQAPGSILVFVQTVLFAERCARLIGSGPDEYFAQREELASLVEDELGSSHELSQYCRHGVAYHHSRLPPTVQRAIEMALSEGWLKVVFSTATLREGLNTTATTVVIAGDRYWDETEERRLPIGEMDFVNIAGRAGRPRADTEGRVILVPDVLAQATAVEAGKRYILMGESALRVRSQLGQLANLLRTTNADLLKLPPARQSLILGLKAAGLTGEDGITSFIGMSLWGLQETDLELTADAARLARKAVASAEETFGEEWVKFAATLGLSLSSADQLRRSLQDSEDLFRADAPSVDRRQKQLSTLVQAVISLPEIHRGYLGRDIAPDAHVSLLQEWIAGLTYESVLTTGKDFKMFSRNARVTEAVKYCSDMSNWLSWGFAAALSVIDAQSSADTDRYIGHLPLLTRYGVPSVAAAYFALLGISDRRAAIALAETYEASGLDVSLDSISRWMSDEDTEKVVETVYPAGDQQMRAELLRGQIDRGRSWRYPFIVADFKASRRIEAGTLADLELRGVRLTVTQSGRVIGAIPQRDRVLAFSGHVLERLGAVVTWGAGNAGDQASLLIIRLATSRFAGV